jgi:hypothetical protein
MRDSDGGTDDAGLMDFRPEGQPERKQNVFAILQRPNERNGVTTSIF